MKQKIIDKGLYIQIMQCSLEVRMENKIEFINKVYMGKEADERPDRASDAPVVE